MGGTKGRAVASTVAGGAVTAEAVLLDVVGVVLLMASVVLLMAEGVASRRQQVVMLHDITFFVKTILTAALLNTKLLYRSMTALCVSGLLMRTKAK